MENNRRNNLNYKVLDIEDLKVSEQDGNFYLEGYVNTKGKPDSYGDIPTGDDVYDVTRMKKNPVCLVDHYNSAGWIAGVFVKLAEDKKGLYAKVRLAEIDDCYTPQVKHAVSMYKKGFGRAFSIGGRWDYDADDRTKLIKATIWEISLVAVGADPRAISDTVQKPKALDAQNSNHKDLKDLTDLEKLSIAIKAYSETGSDEELKKIYESKGK